MSDFKVDKDKAKASLLYIVANVPNIDRHKLYKILYFAEQDHLVKYGKPITGDAFIKMPFGPVPSFVKDVVERNITDDNAVQMDGITVIINEYPDLDELSETNLECLNFSIENYRNKSFSELINASHKDAWNNASQSSRIDSLSIAAEGKADKGMMEYIKRSLDNNSPIH